MFGQSLKTLRCMDCKLQPLVGSPAWTVLRFVQPLNASISISVTLDGTITFVSSLQYSNALLSIFLTEVGISMDLSE